MFVMSKETVKKILSGEINHDDGQYDMDNEYIKGLHFEDQARINLKLEKKHEAVCSALEKACRRENCNLYKTGAGKLEDGWACREYKVDFPSAPFDSRFHVPLIGNDKVDVKDTIDNFLDLKEQGARFICLNCYHAYEKKPKKLFEDGHDGRYVEMCTCGADIFEDIKKFTELIKK